jgi:Ca2+-transporting ATPase
MLLTTLSLFHLAAGLLARDQVRTIFSRVAIPGPTQLRRYGVALLAIIFVTEIGFLQRVFSVVDLTLAQWGICTGIALIARGGRGSDQVLHPASAGPQSRGYGRITVA